MSVEQVLSSLILQCDNPDSDWHELTPGAALKRALPLLTPHSSWTPMLNGAQAPEGMRLNLIVQRFDSEHGVQQMMLHNARVHYVNGDYSRPVYTYATNSYPYAAVEINGWYVTHYAIDLLEFPLPNDVPHNEL